MNFAIEFDSNGNPTMVWDKPIDISTNVWLSLNVTKGSLFNYKEFGLDLSDIKKVTENNLSLIEQRLNAALKWLIDTKKAKSVDIIVERDDIDIYRVNYKVTVEQSDGIPVTVTSFRTVGGTGYGII